MLRFLYVTDLHGWAGGYEAVAQAALDRRVALIVNGGDMLPKGGRRDLDSQRLFLEDFLPRHLESLAGGDVRWLGMFGNDDLACLLPVWRAVLDEHANAHDLSDGWRDVGDGVILRGCPYVPDVPFGLKDWAVLDGPGFERPTQYADPVLSTPDGYEPIADMEAFFRGRPTLEQMLDRLADEAPRLDRAVLVTHSPPAGTRLGCIGIGGWDVGSRAVRRWIERRQPLLTLHGHIHESPDVTGVHTTHLGRTVVHQPGQTGRGAAVFSEVRIKADRVDIERLAVPVPGRRRMG